MSEDEAEYHSDNPEGDDEDAEETVEATEAEVDDSNTPSGSTSKKVCLLSNLLPSKFGCSLL